MPHHGFGNTQSFAPKRTPDTSGFDYNAPAELFPSRNKRIRSNTRYRRFDTAAEAVRFAVEQVPAPALYGAYIEVGEARFGADEIHGLYQSATFPLERTAARK
jgi:hypothetical protein